MRDFTANDSRSTVRRLSILLVMAASLLLLAPALWAWAAPPNDGQDWPTEIEGARVVAWGSNAKATTEAADPAILIPASTVWWYWLATHDGSVTVETAGSDFDTELYVGNGIPLTQIAYNDDAGAATTSRVSFDAVRGTPYLICVDGFAANTGNIKLTVNLLPLADDFAHAQPTSQQLYGYEGGWNQNATKELGEPFHAGKAGGASMWHRWRPSFTGRAGVDTYHSDIDTVLGVYRGSQVDALTKVASNDDAAYERGPSRVLFNVIAGTDYFVAVDSATVQGAWGTGRYSLAYYAIPSLTRPVVSPVSPRRNVGFKTLGLLSPNLGSPVTLYFYRRTGGKWVKAKTVAVNTSALSGNRAKYQATNIKLTSSGYWQVKAYFRLVNFASSAYSAPRVFYVRP